MYIGTSFIPNDPSAELIDCFIRDACASYAAVISSGVLSAASLGSLAFSIKSTSAKN